MQVVVRSQYRAQQVHMNIGRWCWMVAVWSVRAGSLCLSWTAFSMYVWSKAFAADGIVMSFPAFRDTVVAAQAS